MLPPDHAPMFMRFQLCDLILYMSDISNPMEILIYYISRHLDIRSFGIYQIMEIMSLFMIKLGDGPHTVITTYHGLFMALYSYVSGLL